MGCLYPGGQHAALLAVRMKEGATSQGCGASRSWKRREPMLPWSLWRSQPCPRLDFDLQDCEMIKVCGVFFFSWLRPEASRNLVPGPGIEPASPAVEARSLGPPGKSQTRVVLSHRVLVIHPSSQEKPTCLHPGLTLRAERTAVTDWRGSRVVLGAWTDGRVRSLDRVPGGTHDGPRAELEKQAGRWAHRKQETGQMAVERQQGQQMPGVSRLSPCAMTNQGPWGTRGQDQSPVPGQREKFPATWLGFLGCGA